MPFYLKITYKKSRWYIDCINVIFTVFKTLYCVARRVNEGKIKF